MYGTPADGSMLSLKATYMERALHKAFIEDTTTAYLMEHEPKLVRPKVNKRYMTRKRRAEFRLEFGDFPVCEYGEFCRVSEFSRLDLVDLKCFVQRFFDGIVLLNRALWLRGGGVLFRTPRVIVKALMPPVTQATVAWKTYGFPKADCYVPSPEFKTDQI